MAIDLIDDLLAFQSFHDDSDLLIIIFYGFDFFHPVVVRYFFRHIIRSNLIGLRHISCLLLLHNFSAV